MFLMTLLVSSSIAQNQNNVQGSALLDNKLKTVNNQQYNEFDWRLSKALNAKEDGNFVVSPLSVKLALSMLYLGTQGLVNKEIEDAFNINSTVKETVEQKFSSILKSLEAKEEAYELNVGTKLFADKNIKINPTYSKKIKDYYNSSVHPVDFGNKLQTMKDINDWCNKITKGKIPNLITEGDFSDDTVIMLLNAIYFRGEWKFPFASNETKPHVFSVSRNRAVNVHMMSLTEKFGYYDMKDVKAQLIRLPYVGDKFAMYILYPYEVDGLATLARDIKPEILAKSLSQTTEKPINLRLPKFKFESTAELVEVLKLLNIKELFSEKANLEGIGSSSKGPLVISEILQKSGIEVNEKGSTAYATTNVVIDSRFGTESSIDIHITHPFIFLIADEAQNNIIFIGKVIEPLPANGHHSAQGSSLTPLGYDANDYLANQAGFRPNQSPQVDLSEKLNYFDKELLIKTYQQSNPKENIVLSPASIKILLALLLEGASGQTEKEFIDALRLPEDKVQALGVLQRQLASLKNINSAIKIDTQNKVFFAVDEKVSKRYVDVLSKNYGAEFENVNFLKQDEAINTINTWVNQVTRGLITSLVTKDDLDTGTRLLLANCMYFKGEWKYAFDPKHSYTHYFYNSPEPELKTKYMTAEMLIKYHEDEELDAKIAEIPFKDERYTFTVVLPNKRDGITKLLKDLQHNALLKLFSETKNTAVKVTLPRTTIQFKTPLAQILSSPDIEIKDVFTSKANLNGILEMSKPILVKDIFHNAKIELTEEGARAAASSGSNIVLLSASFSPEFKADHPFVYFIRDTQDSGFLFEGVLSSPDASIEPVTILSVDNRNSFDKQPSTIPPLPGRPTTRRAGSSQRPDATSPQLQPQPPTSRPNTNNQQSVANRINGNNQAAQSQQNSGSRPIIAYQAPRPQEKGSVEYPIRQGEQ